MSNPSNTSDEMASASKQHTHLINLVRGMVPPLTSKLHKGQAGTSIINSGGVTDNRSNWCTWRFGRVSPSQEEGDEEKKRRKTDISYCGAPYFSSMGALRFGADLAHVICEPSAGAAIKT